MTTTNTQTPATSLFTVESVGESNFKQLEPGCYAGTCVALTVKNFKKYQSEEVEPKCVFTFQIVDDDDQMHYVRSAPMKLVAHENSGFGKMVTSWLKLQPSNLVGWNVANCLAQPAQCVVNLEQKGDKSYVRLENLLPAKKNQKPGAIADAIPSFIVKDALEYKLADGITIKQEDLITEATPTVPAVSQAVAAAAASKAPAGAGDDDMPFSEARA